MSTRWNWRMRPGSNPGDAISPTPSHIWVGANIPSSSHPNLFTGAVLTHPSLTPTTIRVRLYQELAIRRDSSRRRARSLPCQSSVSCQWAGTLTLGTGVHRGGVVADANIIDIQALPSITTDPSGVRQWMFAARLPEDLPRTWTWAACEGDRKKIWFLDMRYRVIAEAFHNDTLLGAARSFVTFCPSVTECPTRLGRTCTPSNSRGFPASLPLEFAEHFENAPVSSENSSPDTYEPASGSSSEDDRSAEQFTDNSFGNIRRTAMAFARPPQGEDTPRRPRYTDNKPSSSKSPQRLLRNREEKTPLHQAASFPSLTHYSSQPAFQSFPLTKSSSWGAFTSTEDFDDLTITTTLQVSSQPPTPNNHAQFKLTEQVAATINLVPKMALSHLKVTAVLIETIEIVDEIGTRQVLLQHHYRMAVSSIPTTPSKRQEINCIAHMVASDKLFSPDASYDFMRVTHRLDVSISYERRRVLGGLLFGEVAPAEHDLWDIVDGCGMKIVSSTPLCLRYGEKPEQQTTVPWLAVWGSTERIAAVGTAESRVPRRKPGWAASESEESQTQQLESKIDALRSLAYANAGARRREESPEMRPEEDLRRFPTFKVDENSPLAKQTCPVCLERLDGVVTMLPCLHAGHRSCFGRSQNRASVCPVCRLDLNPYLAGEAGRISIETG